jgi:hypothetical protein
MEKKRPLLTISLLTSKFVVILARMDANAGDVYEVE